MDNYEIARERAQAQFAALGLDLEAVARRFSLRIDADYLYLNYLGVPHGIERATARLVALHADAPRPAGFSASLAVYDALSRKAPPALSGRYCATNALPHVAQSSPGGGSMYAAQAVRLDAAGPRLNAALSRLQIAPFAPGDAACVFPVFDFMPAAFQFWAGDDEFPASLHFLWDEHALDCLTYEALYYVMGDFLDLLEAEIAKYPPRGGN